MDDHVPDQATFASSPLQFPPPPPPKPYPPQQRPPSWSSPRQSFSHSSSVKRKPLPDGALPVKVAVVASPPLEQGPQYRTELHYTSPPRKPHSGSVYRSATVTEGTHINLQPAPPRRRNTDEYNLRRSVDEYSLTSWSTTNGSLPRISEDQSPSPHPLDHSSTRSNDLSTSNNIIAQEAMGLKPGTRPPPLRTDSSSSSKSLMVDKKPQTPGSKFSSFFTRKPAASPGAESNITEISDHKSPTPSPYIDSPHPSTTSSHGFFAAARGPQSQNSQDSIDFDGSSYLRGASANDAKAKCIQLEAELRDISTELANSIKREMDLEDLVERLQTEGSQDQNADRTSDYFSDSGTSSVRTFLHELNPKDEMQRVKREADQLRAQLKAEMSQKWQAERASRQTLETHVQILEQKLSATRQNNNQSNDMSARAKELEVALEDARRRLAEERQIKENFEDLLTALRVDLEQHRNERDNLRDEVVPQLRAQIEGLESNFTDSERSPYDLARMQQEIQSLRDENAALQSARAMNMHFQSIAEEGDLVGSPRSSVIQLRSPGGLQRSNTIHPGRSNSRNTPNRSNSLSRSNSIANKPVQETAQSLAEQLKAVEQQRDALHVTVKYLLRRQDSDRRQYEKRIRITQAERDRANSLHGPRKGGYEREVKTLRSEINLLRRRADDALEQKWQCEKGLAGLHLDLERSKQETAGLQILLQARDDSDPEALSSHLEKALRLLQNDREQARQRENLGSLKHEQELAKELEGSAQRSEALASQVRKQMHTNSDLRARLKDAIEAGEANQATSAGQISELQVKLKQLEDVITVAQMQSETAVMKHEDEVRVLRASHNVQLLRTKSGRKTSGLLSPTPRSPLSPMFVNSKKSPRLDQTTSGPGMALQQALKTEYLENKVQELEKALSEAEKEMGEVVGRMNTAQIGVAELEAERDEALRQTKKLEVAIAAEREKVQALLEYDYEDY